MSKRSAKRSGAAGVACGLVLASGVAGLYVAKPQPPNLAVLATYPKGVEYTLTDLGSSSEYASSEAWGINNEGEIIGKENLTSGSVCMFYYHAGTSQQIPVSGACSAFLTGGINNQGTIVGSATMPGSRGWVLLIGTKDGLKIYDLPDGTVLDGLAVNDKGMVAGDYQTAPAKGPANYTLFVIQNGKLTTLWSSDHCLSFVVAGMNDKGQIVGSITLQRKALEGVPGGLRHLGSVGPPKSFVYSDGKLAELPSAPGCVGGSATAIDDKADITGMAVAKTGAPRGFVYSNGLVVGLGPFHAFAMNSAGVLVGQLPNSALRQPPHAAVFENGHAIDLNSLIDPSSGFHLLKATSINDTGQIVGNGMKDGSLHAFLLTPTGQGNVPKGSLTSLLARAARRRGMQLPDQLPGEAASAGRYVDGQYDGPPENAYYGNVSVVAIVQDGKLVDIQCPQYPTGAAESVRINENALPILRSEVIQAQSADVDVVTGATLTSIAYAKSLQAALRRSH